MKYLIKFFGWIGIVIFYVLYILWHFKLPTKKYKKYLKNNIGLTSLGIVIIAIIVIVTLFWLSKYTILFN